MYKTNASVINDNMISLSVSHIDVEYHATKCRSREWLNY